MILKSAESLRQLFHKSARLFDLSAWDYFAQFFRGRLGQLFVYGVITSAQSLLILPVLYLIRFAFDTAIPAANVTLLIYVGVGIFLIRATNSGISLIMRSYILKIIKGTIKEMRQDLVVHLYTLSRDFHTRSDRDKVHARVVQDTERVDNMSSLLLSSILPSVITSGALLIVLLFLNWSLLLLTVSVLPLLWFAVGFTGRYVKRNVFAFQRAFEVFSKGLLFVLRQMDLTRIQAFEKEETNRQVEYIDSLRQTGERMAISYAVHHQVQQNLTGLAGIIILVAGGASIANEIMTLGEFLAFYVAAGLLNGYVNTIMGGLPEVITGNESLVTLRQLKEEGSLDPYSGHRQIQFKGNISLSGVQFNYGDHEVLTDVNLDLYARSNIAIVGVNGAGKSTILNVIIGFCRPQKGQVLADGIPYDELYMPLLRRSIGIVMQHPTFFAGTILQNISYGWPDVSREEVIEAAKVALADSFVSSLPSGYDTEIGEDGVLLSGGECQRLAIARALLGRPKLLILDEPTNHLDTESVDQLMSSLMSQKFGPAILTISHDSHVVSFADTVFTLERGVLTPVKTPTNRVALASKVE